MPAGKNNWAAPAGQSNTFLEFRQVPKGKPQGTIQKLVETIVDQEVNHTPNNNAVAPLQQIALHCALAPGAIVLNGMRQGAHVEDALAVLKSPPLISDGGKTGSKIAEKLQNVCEEMGADGSGFWKK